MGIFTSLYFSSILSTSQGPSQSPQGQLPESSLDRPSVEGTTVVPAHPSAPGSPTPPPTTGLPNSPSHSNARAEVTRLDYLSERWRTAGISEQASELIAHSWRNNTNKQYDSAWKQWISWCRKLSLDPFSSSIANIVHFLSDQHVLGKNYRTINSYRSALSSVLPSIDGFPVGKHPLVSRVLKGIFNKEPPKPRYNTTWEVSQVLDYLCSLDNNARLNLLLLSEKLIALAALVSAQRVQTLSFLDITYMSISDNSAVFQVVELLKTTTTKKGIANQSVELSSFPTNEKLCVLSVLKEYLSRTEPLRQVHGVKKLFISTRKPHKEVTTSTLSRWLKSTLHKAGIDTSVFSAHSYRSASSMAAFTQGVTIEEIMSKANWSNAKTFRDYYFKPVQEAKFASTVLSSSS
ncbi:uncharacterized protein [Diadema antillarum]|uniref:uncharacterized protein n=1 Tax=Diadema antillarum TaxID=105358 RepID=UPI003A889998